jgi:mannan endo-1,4-beta-mannosidase
MYKICLVRILFSSMVCVYATTNYAQTFTVSEGKLLDANGKEFIIRGVNHPHVWFLKESLKSLDRLAELNVNCVRIVWESDGKAKDLKKAIDRCIRLEMIPMVELHDGTGNKTIHKLMELVNYFMRDDIKKILLQYEKYLLLNIANEWGDHTMKGDYWKTGYIQAIDSLRSAGYKTTIVIDAPGWGQDIYAICEYADELTGHDPEKNLLFSVHMYYSWNDAKKIETELQKVHAEKIPLIIGEFGYNYNEGKNNLKCVVDHTAILRKCQELGIGYIPWSWTGNNEANKWLDLAEYEDWKTLTWWGKEIFESENGITRTAKKATVFHSE